MPTNCRSDSEYEHRGSVGTRPSGQLPDSRGFVGRRRELSEIRTILGNSGLVTLTGVGGVGKTSLALRVGAQARRAFPDGVWFVDLTKIRDPELLGWEMDSSEFVAHVVAMELGAAEPTLPGLLDHLADRDLLLILDNCEHMIPGCGLLANALLRTCPRLRILATSREPLRIHGEMTYPVPPLSTPHPDNQPTLADLIESEAAALFTTRAKAAVPTFELTETNYRAVAGICHRLDGVPLAIELAAAWLPTLSPQQILDRLIDRFLLLTRGSRTAPDRQKTLRACLDWSFELCTKPERTLWSRLSVFVGGCELDAVEGICTDDELPQAALLDVIAGLIDKSILICEDHGTTKRFRMLETVHHYGEQHLHHTGEYDTLRRRHRDWYQNLVARARAEWVSDQQGHWLNRIRSVLSNLRAAVEFCLGQPGEAHEAMRLVVTLPWPCWWGLGLFTEGRRWLHLALAQAPQPTVVRAKALLLDAELAIAQGDTDIAQGLLDQGNRLAQRLGDPLTLAYAAHVQGMGALFAGDLPAAAHALHRARTILAHTDEPDPNLALLTLLPSGVTAGLQGDHDLVQECRRHILAITHAGPAFRQAMWLVGVAAWADGNITEAGHYQEEYLRFSQEQGLNPLAAARSLEVLAWVSAKQRQYQRAATLLGAAGALFRDVGTSFRAFKHLVGFHQTCAQETREALADTVFEDTVERGRNLTYEGMLAYVLGEKRPEPAPAGQVTALLTRREREVADLVAQGHSNKEIAAALVISLRTAETHVENILRKLGFTSRSQVAAWAYAQRRTGDNA
ncbi:ATP-binding protein [Saccharopolyspora phatthalungensis]|uniref:Putative ATPase/DNA-binding NarL/FixJ family response regulator n=1 Tax=Saccharopolyspora phatthalungensis TaxID=664693 RepID=A0A840Q8T1_9PSEU|nr:LuxR C-terminal-related transcriptional regulator [Saccharopolyspora phatthalungensis]MBB5158942.1 putative ATPase/DNA-binding NarL/FixJ family response regulator [Saccharopolyspora phatthalungensis]